MDILQTDKTQNAPNYLRKYPKRAVNRRHIKIIKLLGDPSLTQTEIAQLVGCSLATVKVIARQLREEIGSEELELQEYRKLTRKKIPQSIRVDSLATIISPEQAKSNPFSVIRGIEYVDTLLGLHPKARQEDKDQQQQAQPMFMLPAGAQVQVNVIKVSPRRSVKRVEGSRED